jgi:hypothetical protein
MKMRRLDLFQRARERPPQWSFLVVGAGVSLFESLPLEADGRGGLANSIGTVLA